jgi:hypothetical protein
MATDDGHRRLVPLLASATRSSTATIGSTVSTGSGTSIVSTGSSGSTVSIGCGTSIDSADSIGSTASTCSTEPTTTGAAARGSSATTATPVSTPP